MPDEKRQIDPKPLSVEYHKAHKQLMLWAAILFIWELVGIDLEKAKEAGGNAGAIISAIKSPQAVPWALMILVAYFLFKTTVEWFQCSNARRMLRVAKIDFLAAWVVPLIAYALYAYQAIKKVQFADVLQRESNSTAWVLTGLTMGVVLSQVALSAIKFTNDEFKELGTWKRRRLFIGSFGFMGLVVLILPIIAARLLFGSIQWRSLSGGFLVAIMLFVLGELFLRKVWPFTKNTLAGLFSKESITADKEE